MLTQEDIQKALDDFMNAEEYTPPIEIYQTIEQVNRDFIKNQENEVMMQINQYVNVDKDELIKALNYDRDQYHKGFEDGARVVLRELEIYKTALKLACETISFEAPKFDDTQYYIDLYLKKAREEE